MIRICSELYTRKCFGTQNNSSIPEWGLCVITHWHEVTGCLNLSTVEEISQQVGTKGDFFCFNDHLTINAFTVSTTKGHHVAFKDCKNLVHIQTPFISKLFIYLLNFFVIWFHWRKHYQTGFYFILDWTVQRRGLISLFVLSVLGFSRGSRSSRPCFTLSPGSPCWEGTVTQHCARPGAGTHIHTVTHSHTQLSISYI